MVAVAIEPLRSSVLVVEDNEGIQQAVADALRTAGYQVHTAANGREALAVIDHTIPDVIVSDIIMPELNGIELLTALRADAVLRSIPVIFLSSKSETEDIVEGLDLGADDYVPKPFRTSELEARVRAKIARPPVPLDQLPRDRQTNLYSSSAFLAELDREILRTRRGGGRGTLALVDFPEFERINSRFGARFEDALEKQMSALLTTDSRALDIVGVDLDGRFSLLLPETGPEGAEIRLRRLHRLIVTHTFQVGDERFNLTPISGYATYDVTSTTDDVCRQALIALDMAEVRLDLEPIRWEPAMGNSRSASENGFRRRRRPPWFTRLQNAARLPFQIVLVHVAGMVLPFLGYVGLYKAGLNIAPAMYIVVVLSLLFTAILIWIEGFAALRPDHLPETDGPAAPVTAIIAAYLPNEAATIVETVESFLQLEYEGSLQVILAYNSPRDLPVEDTIRKIAMRDARFVPLRGENSTSKAQNVNAGLAEAKGEIIGIFDADHHPAPDAFTRAWRWIANGYDLVQGHCQIRNGGDSRLSRTIAVEFEAIYAVAHPGRARVHHFGLFGGSNGYWKADVLRRTRMHGFMLTEDIDSSIRVVIDGHKIKSDPGLISRELAPVNLTMLWNQRLRWAQGWFQVSRRHFLPAMRSKHIGWRPKFGLFHLLVWREIYPWLSLQMWPVIGFYIWQAGSPRALDWTIPIFVLTTIFTLSVGPGQVLFSYLLAAPDVRRHRSWFWLFLFWAPFYSELKSCIGRVAQVKELMGERAWKVTPRAAQPAAPGAADSGTPTH